MTTEFVERQSHRARNHAEPRVGPRLGRGVDLLPVEVEPPIRDAILNRRNPVRSRLPCRKDHEVVPDPRVEVVGQVGEQLRFGTHRGVADPGDEVLATVEDPQQVYQVGLRDLIHPL